MDAWFLTFSLPLSAHLCPLYLTLFSYLLVTVTPTLSSFLFMNHLTPPQDPAGIFELVEVVGNGTYGQVYKVSSSTMLFYPSLFLFSLRFLHVNEPKQINKLYGIGKFKKENIC